MIRRLSLNRFSAYLSCFIALGSSAFADFKGDVGHTKLQAELGSAMLTGSGCAVSQNEAAVDAAGSYRPNTAYFEFTGKTFTVASGTATGISSHATTVAQYYYGTTTSTAPGISDIDLYDANTWLGSGFLNANTTTAPKPETSAFLNSSWVGTVDSSGTTDVDVLRRYDYAMSTNNFLGVSAVNNGASTTIPSLLASSYNGLVAGLTNGGHSTGTTVTDGTGRVKPEIVSPVTATSWAAPTIGAAGALLLQNARASSPLASATNAIVIKALLLAGATKSQFPSWNRTTTRPIDSHYGAGQLNIYNSYHILSAGRQLASSSALVRSRGWAFAATTGTGSYYFFDIPAGNTAPGLSAILTWNRVIQNTIPPPKHGQAGWGSPSSTLPNLALSLYNASGFTVGTQVDTSISTLDNLQHIYQPNLPAGRYALQVSSTTTAINYALAWISLPTVSISASTPDAYKQGLTPGVFTFSRSGETVDPLTVYFTFGGTAVSGSDYGAVASSVVIPSGTNSVTLPITPLAAQSPVGDRTVTLSLSTDLAYSVAASGSAATITIHDTPYNQWLLDNFSQAEIAAGTATGSSADPDLDGISNLMEYALNLDPTAPGSSGIPVPTIQSGTLTLTYTEVKSATDITYLPEISTDLTAWHSGAGYTSVSQTVDNGATRSVTVSSLVPLNSASRQFMRIRVTRP